MRCGADGGSPGQRSVQCDRCPRKRPAAYTGQNRARNGVAPSHAMAVRLKPIRFAPSSTAEVKPSCGERCQSGSYIAEPIGAKKRPKTWLWQDLRSKIEDARQPSRLL